MGITRSAETLDIVKEVAYSVLSLLIHTGMTREIQNVVIDDIKRFYK